MGEAEHEPDVAPSPDPAALRAQAVRRGIARGAVGLGLSVPFMAVAGAEPKALGFGACMGLGLFGQALLEHGLRRVGPRGLAGHLGVWLACWGFACAGVLLALAQAFALPELLIGNTEGAQRVALELMRRIVLEKPDEGAAIVFGLGSPLALYTGFLIWGRPWPGLTGFALANLVFSVPLYLALGHEAGLFHGFLATTAALLPALRLLGDVLEARFVVGADSA